MRVVLLPHPRKGMDYLHKHPQKREGDPLQAFRSPQIDMILCAVGGDDTYRLLPYLFDYGELSNAACDNPNRV